MATGIKKVFKYCPYCKKEHVMDQFVFIERGKNTKGEGFYCNTADNYFSNPSPVRKNTGRKKTAEGGISAQKKLTHA
ncbi:MAG: hypothetical protein IJI14_07930 [Anaerolineaceae bacterium]|nr:hypothetical protein [Anaerolineaceae bacterium]